MDWGKLFLAIFKSFFIALPIMIVWIAIKIKWKEWREKKLEETIYNDKLL